MEPIQLISQDLFDKVRSRFENLEMGDETGAVTVDPANARFFDFDFIHENTTLGRISISLNDIGSLKIYYSRGITEDQDEHGKSIWYNFLKEMRKFAMRRLLRFDTRDVAKSNLDKNDFQYLANKQIPKDNEQMSNNVTESRWNQKSSRKTSRAVKGTTEVIVRHHSPVDEMYPGARSQKKNIKAIYIQNRDGERFKYPFIHPAGAFAMAQHVDHGGVPHDPAGKAIINMSEQIAQLQEFQRKIQRTQLHDDAMGITERAIGRLQELKSTIESLGKRHYYEAWCAEFNNSGALTDSLSELDPVTMEDYKSKFTQTSFKEELATYFPLIHSIMQETNKIDLEEYVEENAAQYEVSCSQCGNGFNRNKKEGFSHCKDHANLTSINSSVKENVFSQFESWAEAVEQGKLTDDQIKDLQNALETTTDLKLGPDGQIAWEFFSSFGLTDSDLEDKLRAAADLDQETDPMEVLQVWANDHYPELLVALGMSGTDSGNNEVEQPPVAESSEDYDKILQAIAALYGDDMWDNDAMQDLANDLEQAGPSDQELDFIIANGKLPNRLANIQFTNSDDVQFGKMEEGKDRKAIVQEVAKIVKSFYNRDNPEVGPFRSEEGIAIDVEKKISEKFGDRAGQSARQLAEKFMEKLTLEWNQRHSADQVAPVNPDDGLARLKELIGNVKQQVEGIGDQGVAEGYQEYDALQDKIEQILIKVYNKYGIRDQIIDVAKPMAQKVAQQMGLEKYFDEIWSNALAGHDVDTNFGDDDDSDYTDYSMRQGEMGNPDRALEDIKRLSGMTK